MGRAIPIALSWVIAAACGGPSGSPPEAVSTAAALELAAIEFERPARSGEPNLHAAPDGTALLTWLEPAEGDDWALRLSRRSDTGWSDPVTIRRTDRFFVNWADFPSSVQMEGGTIAVHWLEKVAASTYAYHVMLATSSDGGASWSAPFRAHRDESPTEHGFVSMVPWEGGAAIAWLDGQDLYDPDAESPSDDGGHGGGSGGAMSVRFTTLAPDGRLGAEVLLDPRSCECCQTALATTGHALIAAYRDRSPEEVRDIAVVRGIGETWSEPSHVSADAWTIPGCPVNGPQLVAAGEEVAAAWYTGAGGDPQVYAAFSRDGGQTFGTRIRIDEGLPMGRVDIERLDDGSVLVTWLEASDDRARVLVRRVSPRGGVGEAVVITETDGARASGFPRMVRLGSELLFAWTLPGDGGGIRVRSARITD